MLHRNKLHTYVGQFETRNSFRNEKKNPSWILDLYLRARVALVVRELKIFSVCWLLSVAQIYVQLQFYGILERNNNSSDGVSDCFGNLVTRLSATASKFGKYDLGKTLRGDYSN